jgi:hypothetical protein
MKILFTLLFTFNLYATETSLFDILPGKFHKGGYLIAEPSVINNEEVKIKMNYEIYKKGYVPVPSEYLKGVYEQNLPAMFMDERGYLELEKLKEINLSDAKIVHLGRVVYGEYNDAHHVHIIPHNKKSEMYLVYHTNNIGLGWDQLKLIIHTPIPLLKSYLIRGKHKPH